MKKSVVLLALYFCMGSLCAQNLSVADSIAKDTTSKLTFNYKQLIIPGVLIGYGLVGLESDQLKSFNTEIREEVQEHIDDKTTVDDFGQWVPAASVFALDALGIKAKHNVRDRAVLFTTSFTIMSVTVFSLKSITKVQRPDGTSFNSFPSGHTATAFAGAELLYQEYKDQSVWYGIVGYAVATGTGLFRVYNNRHWFTDIAAGAGIGILSTKIAYWITPWLTNVLFNGKSRENKSSAFIMPFYDGKIAGVSFAKTF